MTLLRISVGLHIQETETQTTPRFQAQCSSLFHHGASRDWMEHILRRLFRPALGEQLCIP